MKKYEGLNIEIIHVTDVITTSDPVTPPAGDEYEGEIDWV